VFFAVVLAVRWGAGLVEKTINVAMLGWVNKIGGAALYAALYIILLSVFLFYAQKINLLNADTVQASKTYPFIQPWAPRVIDGFGTILPWFKNMFGELEAFFGKIATNAGK
jgi:membrane protein required for colicin V production